jgi:hypothetical protein
MKKDDFVFAQLLKKTGKDSYRSPFPKELNNISGNYITSTLGLTKKELFAAMAMQGMLASGADRQQAHRNSIYAVASANALLLELNKERNQSNE